MKIHGDFAPPLRTVKMNFKQSMYRMKFNKHLIDDTRAIGECILMYTFFGFMKPFYFYKK